MEINEGPQDADLIRAVRKRLMSEIESPRDLERVVNNIYGGQVGGQPPTPGGVMDQLAHKPGPGGEDPFDYFVDIVRKDLPDVNPHTGKPEGWEKKVHRFRGKKKVMEGEE